MNPLNSLASAIVCVSLVPYIVYPLNNTPYSSFAIFSHRWFTLYSVPVFAVHCAVTLVPSNGIVLGTSGCHPANVYPVLVGSAGSVTADSYFPVIVDTAVPQLLSNVILYSFLL